MKAVIMAGGEGTRLRPLTCMGPKPMVELVGKPMMQYTVELLKRHGITDMAMTLMYMPEKIRSYFGDGSRFGVHIEYFVESTPLGTAGSVKNAASFLDEPFLIISGDALTDLNISKAINFHKSQKSKATIILKPMENPLEYGIVLTDENAHITRFFEKPGWSEVFSDTVNTGMYILEPEILDLIPEGKNFDFSKQLFPLLIQRGIPLSGYIMGEYWCDVGNIDAFLSAGEDILKGSVEVEIPGTNINGLWVQEGVHISNSALIQAPGFIGKNSDIEDAARIGQYSVIGKNAKIGANANIKRSYIGNNVSVGASVKASHSTICDNSVIGAGCRLFEGSAIGKNCVLESGVTVSPRVKIWPDKWIEKNTTVNAHIVWGYGKRAELFTIHGIAGRMNADLYADTAARAGAAFGTVAAPRGNLLLAHDGDAGSEILEGAFAHGACSVGTQVLRAGKAQLAEVYLYTRDKNMQSCGYIRQVREGVYSIALLGKQGEVLEKGQLKKLNDTFDKGEFLRTEPRDLLPPLKSPDIHGHYLESLKSVFSADFTGERKPCIGVIPTDTPADDFLMDAIVCAGFQAKQGKRPGKEVLFAVRMEANGMGELLAEESRISGELLEIMTYALGFELFHPKSVRIPMGTPGAVEILAEKQGIALHRDPHVYYDPALYRMFNDLPYLCILLAEKLIRSDMTLEEYLRSLPAYYAHSRQVNCDWKDIGRILKQFCEAVPGGVMEKGVQIQTEKGRGWICPDDYTPSIHIRAEGMNEEFSRELCDLYTDKVRELLKRNPQ